MLAHLCYKFPSLESIELLFFCIFYGKNKKAAYGELNLVYKDTYDVRN